MFVLSQPSISLGSSPHTSHIENELASSVTWNDGNCNYHSKSYYCQTVGGKKNKVTSTLPPWKRAEKWKLVMKVSGDATFGYSSAYWTNDALLNENADGKAIPDPRNDVTYTCTTGGSYNTYHQPTLTAAQKAKAAKLWPGKPASYFACVQGCKGTCKATKSASSLAEAFNAKYPAFTKVPFSKIKMCVGKPGANCVEHKFTRDYANAKALFAAGYLRDKTVDQKGILKAFGPAKDSYQSCPMQRPGFNIQCNDGNKARWGYCTNCASQPCQNSDSNDADASIGIGLAGQSTPRQMGAGWTNYFASGKGTCNANSMTEKHVFFYVYENTML